MNAAEKLAYLFDRLGDAAPVRETSKFLWLFPITKTKKWLWIRDQGSFWRVGISKGRHSHGRSGNGFREVEFRKTDGRVIGAFVTFWTCHKITKRNEKQRTVDFVAGLIDDAHAWWTARPAEPWTRTIDPQLHCASGVKIRDCSRCGEIFKDFTAGRPADHCASCNLEITNEINAATLRLQLAMLTRNHQASDEAARDLERTLAMSDPKMFPPEIFDPDQEQK